MSGETESAIKEMRNREKELKSIALNTYKELINIKTTNQEFIFFKDILDSFNRNSTFNIEEN